VEKIEDVVRSVPAFGTWSHSDRIRFIGWYLHVHEGLAYFEIAHFRRAYESMSLAQPSNFSQLLNQLVQQKHMLKNAKGIALERRVREKFDSRYGQRPTTVEVTKLLAELPLKIPQLAERDFLDEAIKCFRCGAFRAAIVMTWNLAYDHFVDWVLKNHITAFNVQWPISFQKDYAKARILAISKRDDFSELKESQVIQICRSAGLITGDVKNMLEEKLEKRNSAAHPSNMAFTQVQAEAFIDDLVRNIVLKLF
jgi:hypothetical protein